MTCLICHAISNSDISRWRRGDGLGVSAEGDSGLARSQIIFWLGMGIDGIFVTLGYGNLATLTLIIAPLSAQSTRVA